MIFFWGWVGFLVVAIIYVCWLSYKAWRDIDHELNATEPATGLVRSPDYLGGDVLHQIQYRSHEVSMDKRLFLKVKLKSLAAEARIIRKEELRRLCPIKADLPASLAHNPLRASAAEEFKLGRRSIRFAMRVRRKQWHEKQTLEGRELRESLHAHRIFDVRHEARHTHLAYGFIRGKTYRSIENKASKPIDVPKVVKMVDKYGDRLLNSAATKDAVEKWLGGDAA